MTLPRHDPLLRKKGLGLTPNPNPESAADHFHGVKVISAHPPLFGPVI